MFWNKTSRNFPYQQLTDKRFDCREQVDLIGTDQRNCHTLQTSPTGAADTMNIVFRDFRQINIDNVRKFVDIDATRGDIRGNQRHGLYLP